MVNPIGPAPVVCSGIPLLLVAGARNVVKSGRKHNVLNQLADVIYGRRTSTGMRTWMIFQKKYFLY